MYYFYILQSQKDGALYYGSSSDLARRLNEHKNGQVVSTKNRLPVDLVYYEAYLSKDLALHRELTVKKSQGARNALQNRIFL